MLAALALMLALVKHRALLRIVRNYFFEPGSALGLALMRVTVFWMLFNHASPERVLRFTSLPEFLRRPPPGWGWLTSVLPFDATSARAITIAFGVASALAVLGAFTRVTTPIAALLGLYVLGVQNFCGKINHSMHGAMMCAMVLAASPCGDALSLDRLWRRRRGEGPPLLSGAYTVPLRFCFLILGTVYLFPGLYKLWRAGDLWLSGVQLPALLHSVWSRSPDFVPLWRVDEHPLLMKLLGAGTLLLEIGFIFMLFNRWTRVLAAFGAVAFHWSVLHLMDIRFRVLFPLVLLYDLPGLPDALAARFPKLSQPFIQQAHALRARIETLLSTWFEPATTPRPRSNASWIAAATVGGFLFSAQMYVGAEGIDSWPIAVHPRFARRLESGPRKRQRFTIVVDRASRGGSIDMGDALRAFGIPRSVKMLRRLCQLGKERRDAPERIAAERAVIDLLAKHGVTLKAGDRVAIVKEQWRLFPLDRRDDLKTRRVRRWEVTSERRLEPEKKKKKHKKKKKKKSR